MAAFVETRVAVGPIKAGVDTFHRINARLHSPHPKEIFIENPVEISKYPLREVLLDLSLAVGTYILATVQRNSF